MNTKEFDNAMKILFHTSCLYDKGRWTRFSSRKVDEHNFLHDLFRYTYEGMVYHLLHLMIRLWTTYKLVAAFVKRYSIDKMNTIFLTDGSI